MKYSYQKKAKKDTVLGKSVYIVKEGNTTVAVQDNVLSASKYLKKGRKLTREIV